MKLSNGKKVIIIALLIYLFLPLLGTLIYSISTKWQATLLPNGLTLKWYEQLFSDVRFVQAIQRSFLTSGLTCLLSLTVMIPTIFIMVVYYPKLEKVMKFVITLPFAMPGIVLAVGLIKLYSGDILPLTGTIWILVGAYFVLIMPFMYQGIRNAMRTVEVKTLMEAASLLGASDLKAFWYVIFPNLIKGVVVSTLLSFSMLFGEFVLANILAGGNYETIQVYLYTQKGSSGHFTSAIVISYFSFILLLSYVIIKIKKIVDPAGR
ncbi:ABC transporter permease [Fusibacter sp. 3D3]|uniref:ABC transporter permease n=1 Tax=Fusibacter sp. 3D3 TaxID=1048380 RepID=UPI00085395FE|nr:ABC transporter permease subunit [Fusibacter sp. 3D3]GAU79569.1 thiamin ABC transporter [Fusibacter sp. 3D3]